VDKNIIITFAAAFSENGFEGKEKSEERFVRERKSN